MRDTLATGKQRQADDIAARAARTRHVCVVGNLNIDLILRGMTDIPHWGQEVAATSHVAASSGQAGYLSMALGRLGVPVSVVANVGSDLFGRQILDDLNKHAVDADAVEISPGKTGITVGLVREDGERAFASDFACLHDFDEAMLSRHADVVATADLVCLVGQFCLPNFPFAAAGRLLKGARSAGKLTMLDTGWDPANWPAATVNDVRSILTEVDIFLPNNDEATVLTGETEPLAAAHLLQGDGPGIVVVKRGAAGSLLLDGDQVHALPALPALVHDAVGAGDTFDAGFLYGLIRGWPPKARLAFGNAAASLYVSRLADRFPLVDDVLAAATVYKAGFPAPGKD